VVDADVAVVSNPEFLREGAAIQDFKHPDRIVVGTEDEAAAKVMGELYRPLYINRSPILVTGRRTAELTNRHFPGLGQILLHCSILSWFCHTVNITHFACRYPSLPGRHKHRRGLWLSRRSKAAMMKHIGGCPIRRFAATSPTGANC